MLTSRWPALSVVLCLIGCNSPTPLSELRVPHFSSEHYEHLDCHKLKEESDKIDVVIQKLSGVKNEPRYIMHSEMPFVGTGDNMGAVELVKYRAERNAIQRAYDLKKCIGIAY
jgi:hypothetical protein